MFRLRLLLANRTRKHASSDGRGNADYSPARKIVNRRRQASPAKIRDLEAQLDAELAKTEPNCGSGWEQGRIAFEKELLRRHRELKTALGLYLWNAHPMVVITAPVIYALIVPFALLDLCRRLPDGLFPAYGIPKVKRADYFVFDRHHLAYLNALEKLNCACCSYVNCLIVHIREIAGRTEQYWCSIKHTRRVVGAHPLYVSFDDDCDADAYQKRVAELREKLARGE